MPDGCSPGVLDFPPKDFSVGINLSSGQNHCVGHRRITIFETFCLVQIQGDVESSLFVVVMINILTLEENEIGSHYTQISPDPRRRQPCPRLEKRHSQRRQVC
jgi:hypothetical protein